MNNTSFRQAIQTNHAYLCLECGKCTSVCPVARREPGFSPRLMVEALVSGRAGELISDRQLWSCLTCQRCSEVCPSAVRFSEFMRDIRVLALQDGQRGHCSHGETIQTWMRLMAKPDISQNRLDWLDDSLRTSETSDTIYFAGCLPYYDVLFEKIGAQGVEIARSAVKLLNHLGIEPIVLADERCCGHDLLWHGDVETFEQLADLNAELFAATGARRIVTTCPECAQALKVDYGRRVRDLGLEVVHISQLLAEAELEWAPPSGQPVTYQDPCRLGRHLGVYEPPRQLIAALGAELVEMEHCRGQALCCGTSGWTNCGASSKRIQVDRLREAKETGAELLVTACAKCQIHFKCAMEDRYLGDELEIEIKDLVVLLAEALVNLPENSN